ncbi:hypothetical protein [Microbacterium sp. UFMG61]|uniref:DprA-like winged helix domain-containing protein n=1 Tax=Microbacterium sp. UFMG61 TaxID=2745935 RepID=UPI003A5C5111
MPGPVTSAASAGCHRLLREYDARCVTNTSEVRELWEGAPRSVIPETRATDPEQRRLLDAIGTRSWVPLAEIGRRAGLAPDRTRALLGVLELEGAVERSDAGWRKKRMEARRG